MNDNLTLRSGKLIASLLLLAAIPCGAQASAADAAAAPAADPKVAQFETLAQSIMQNPLGASEEQILSLIASANERGRFYATNIAIKAWLARQTSPSAAVLRASAENASLAGDLRTAASRYKLLIAASPADEGRSRAAAKLYEILIDDLGNFIIIRAAGSSDLLDKRGRKVNRRGYLIDRFGNVINSKGNVIFKAMELDVDDEIPVPFDYGTRKSK